MSTEPINDLIAPPAPDALPDVRVSPPGPASRAWLARLAAVESPNVTCVGPEFPVVWAAARGAAVRDVDGNTYVDATSAFGVSLIGHAHPEIVAAASAQVATLAHGMGDVHPPSVRIALLERLVALAPEGLSHAVLCTGGAEAVEVALKTAALATGKAGVLSFDGAYHGLALGALDVTSRRDFRTPFWSMLGRNATFAPFPDPRHPPRGVSPEAVLEHCLGAVERALAGRASGSPPIGAVIVEPIQGRGGTRIPPDGLLTGLRALCDTHGALLVFDEIMTGLGRTGRLWACDHEGLVPDLLCVGKALGGGFPVSACLGRADVVAAWGPSTGEALHTSTFLGHPVASSAALAALHVTVRDDIPGRASDRGEVLMRALRDRLGADPRVRSLRGRGLMIGFDLVDPSTGSPDPAEAFRRTCAALRRGVLVLPAGVLGETIQLLPPACVTDAQIAAIAEAVAA